MASEGLARLRRVAVDKSWTDKLKAAKLALLTDECGDGPGFRMYCDAVNFTSAAVCEDDTEFRDKTGGRCASWVAVDCNQFKGYSPADLADVREYCPAACNANHCQKKRNQNQGIRLDAPVTATRDSDVCVEKRITKSGPKVVFLDIFAHMSRLELRAIGYLPAVATPLHHTSVMAPPDPRAVAVKTYGADILRFVSRNPAKDWKNLTSRDAAEHTRIKLGPIRLTNFTPMLTELTEPTGEVQCITVQHGPTCLLQGPFGYMLESQRRSRFFLEGKWFAFNLPDEVRDIRAELGVVTHDVGGGRSNSAVLAPAITLNVSVDIMALLRDVLDQGVPGDLVEFGAGDGSLTVHILRLLELYHSEQDLYVHVNLGISPDSLLIFRTFVSV